MRRARFGATLVGGIPEGVVSGGIVSRRDACGHCVSGYLGSIEMIGAVVTACDDFRIQSVPRNHLGL